MAIWTSLGTGKRWVALKSSYVAPEYTRFVAENATQWKVDATNATEVQAEWP